MEGTVENGVEVLKASGGSWWPARFTKTGASFLALGFATTIGVCVGAVVWNAMSMAVDMEKVTSSSWNEVLSVPTESPLHGRSAWEIRYRGLAVFKPEGVKEAASELKDAELGPIRSAAYLAQPLLYSSIASQPRKTQEEWRCGGATGFDAGTDPPRTTFDWCWIGAGWPFIAFQCDAGLIETRGLVSRKIFARWFGVSGGSDVSELLPQRSRGRWGVTQQTVLPLTPVWAGLGADSVLYGSIWFAIASGVRGVRRLWEPRRGCCRGCGYDMAGLHGTMCPECGLLARP
ncbi:MAG: hypothetical protein JNK16_07590 [Phycisphaerales bacterium]|nr:hypothetical protein [Phycisphaerales bacterium]